MFVFTYQCKHNENRGWKKTVALISLCLFVFYFILLRVVRRSLALKTTAYVCQLFTTSHRCVCARMCFRLAVGISQFSAQLDPSQWQSIFTIFPPLSPRPSPSSPLLQSSAEPSPVWSSDRDGITVSVVYLQPVTPHTRTNTNTQKRCTLLNTNNHTTPLTKNKQKHTLFCTHI